MLGAQAVGMDGVEKRIDVMAVAIRAGMNVYDLEEMELCYAPPYGSAKDRLTTPASLLQIFCAATPATFM